MIAEHRAHGTGDKDHVQRIYSCPKCGYRMRFDTSRCSDCWEKAPIYNRRWFWRLLYSTGATALAVGVLWALSAML